MRPFIAVLVAMLLPLTLVAPAHAASPIEDYASYQEPGKCHPKPYAGTRFLGKWVARHYGGGYVGSSRACAKKQRRATSEHQTGRAFDWSHSVKRRSDRADVRDLLHDLFATDARGNTDARARRMGIMYVIWNDQMYPAWDEFRPEPYLSSGCRTKKRCSPTLRHRDHVHISLSLAGARGRTSFYDGRL